MTVHQPAFEAHQSPKIVALLVALRKAAGRLASRVTRSFWRATEVQADTDLSPFDGWQ